MVDMYDGECQRSFSMKHLALSVNDGFILCGGGGGGDHLSMNIRSIESDTLMINIFTERTRWWFVLSNIIISSRSPHRSFQQHTA